MTGIVSAFMLGAAALGVGLLYVAGSTWRQRRPLSALVAMLAGLFGLSFAALCGTISVGIRGYRALTAEEVAARIRTEPIGPQRFRTTVLLPDGTVRMFDIAGDAIYVDAHILKWRPFANLLGLHTAYELDRIAGRYRRLGDEQTRERTVYSLARSHLFNAFDLAQRYWVLRPLVDAQYGSATFINATAADGAPNARAVTYEVRVSTTGLLVRAAPPQ